jgi:hypothetical protein
MTFSGSCITRGYGAGRFAIGQPRQTTEEMSFETAKDGLEVQREWDR